MKKLLTIIAVLFTAQSFAQDTIALYQMNKVQLSKLYLEEVTKKTINLPVIPFDSAMVDVPKSKYLNAKFKSVAEKVSTYNKTLLEEYAEIIPYADKKDLIDAILYLRSIK